MITVDMNGCKISDGQQLMFVLQGNLKDTDVARVCVPVVYTCYHRI